MPLRIQRLIKPILIDRGTNLHQFGSDHERPEATEQPLPKIQAATFGDAAVIRFQTRGL